jgi:hypothetical protein
MTWIFFLHFAGWHRKRSDHHWCPEWVQDIAGGGMHATVTHGACIFFVQSPLQSLNPVFLFILPHHHASVELFILVLFMHSWCFLVVLYKTVSTASVANYVLQILYMFLLCRNVCKQARRWSPLLLLFSMEFTVVSNWQQILQFICLERTWIGSCANLQIWKLENKLDLT